MTDAEIDNRVAHPARMYDYLLGGVANFQVDRDAADSAAAAFPEGRLEMIVRSQRVFLGRAVRYLALDAGIRHFLDIGTGIPNEDNVHGVAQQCAPECRIVYVDRDPVVLAHSHTLLQSTPEGATKYLHGDFLDPEPILRRAAATVDLTRPVAILLVGILHLIRDGDDPYEIVGRLLAAVPSGSYVVISHAASDIEPELTEAVLRVNERTRDPYILRSRAAVSRFVEDVEVVDPGFVTLDQWRHRVTTPISPVGSETIPIYGAVGRKT